MRSRCAESEMRRPTVRERAQQTRRLLQREGYAGVANRLRERVSSWLSPPGSAPLPVSREDFVRAAELATSDRELPPPLPLAADGRLEVAWVCVPQAAGAGGFTTLFRLASSLEQAGHRCIIYLHDRHGWSLEQHQKNMRAWWPSLQAEIRDASEGIEDAHAIFASSWETAYPVLASPARRGALLSGAGRRAAVLPCWKQCLARRGHLSLRVSWSDPGPLARAKTSRAWCAAWPRTTSTSAPTSIGIRSTPMPSGLGCACTRVLPPPPSIRASHRRSRPIRRAPSGDRYPPVR